MWYIASPYSHPDPLVRDQRAEAVQQFAGWCALQGYHVITTIGHWHAIEKRHGLPTDYLFWQAYNHNLIDHLDGVMVLMIDDWKQSKGVDDEIRYALARGKLLRFWFQVGEAYIPYTTQDVSKWRE